MIVSTTRLLSLLALAALVPELALAGAPTHHRRSLANKYRRRAEKIRRQENAQESLTLDPNVIQEGLKQDGQGDNVEAGQVRSLTSSNNFINFCLTQNVPLTNGQQIREGSCNPTPIGRVAAQNRMPSSKFKFPPNGDRSLVAGQAFTIEMRINNLQTGNFVNPQTNYYAAPQQVNGDGIIIGHSHVVIEKIPSLDATEPLDPTIFAFFKGLNGVAQGGILTADVTNGLEAGFYRMSSINAAANHQPAIVAVAQHGSLDDGVYFEVRAPGDNGGNNGGNGDNNGGNGGNNGGNGGNNGGNGGNNGGNGGNNGGNGGNNGGNGGNNGGNGDNNGGNGDNNGGNGDNNGGNGDNNGGNGGNNGGNGGNNGGNGGNNGGNGGNNGGNGGNNGGNGGNNGGNGGNNGGNGGNNGGNGGNNGGNLQLFTGALGGLAPNPVTASGNQFVSGGVTFNFAREAIARSCDVQRNACGDQANRTGNLASGLNQNSCQEQLNQCRTANNL